MNINNFFKKDFTNFSVYSTYRGLGNYIDGQKPSSRKVVQVMMQNNISKNIKVATLGSKVIENTEYLHGEASMFNVIIGMAKNYPGTNNLNIIVPEGSFGNRIINDAAAPRYIYTKKSPIFDSIFHKDDLNILDEQFFEGTKIEPKTFLPIIPLILINGSEGIGSGFSQKILPRNVYEIIDYIKKYLKKEKLPSEIIPSFKNFKGFISKDEECKYIISGKLKIKNTSTIIIEELPIGYDLKSYIKVLNQLEDTNKIKSYKDSSNKNNFYFEIKVERKIISEKTEEQLIDLLKLNKRVSENFTVINESNSIELFNNEIELINSFIENRLFNYQKRKDKLIEEIEEEIKVINAKWMFIKSILDGQIKVHNRKKTEIENQLIENKFYKVNDSYNFLLNMPIHSFSEETFKELKKNEDLKIKEKNKLQKKTIKSFWMDDLNKLEQELKKQKY